eukprot:6459495-Amphidinium_carterae.1
MHNPVISCLKVFDSKWFVLLLRLLLYLNAYGGTVRKASPQWATAWSPSVHAVAASLHPASTKVLET